MPCTNCRRSRGSLNNNTCIRPQSKLHFLNLIDSQNITELAKFSKKGLMESRCFACQDSAIQLLPALNVIDLKP